MEQKENAITLGEFRELSKNLPDNLILFVMRGANLHSYPITKDNWKVYEAGEIFFENATVTNQEEPGLRISII
jgi:hypothetical protein